MAYKQVKRIQYPAQDIDEVNPEEMEFDFVNFFENTASLHHTTEHDWGVAAGLEVSATSKGDITVAPGVAIDSQGRVIVLPGKPGDQVVTIENADLDTGKIYYITIRHQEKSEDWKSGSERKKYFLAPEVQAEVKPEGTGRLPEEESALVLAVVELNNKDRTIKTLAPALAGAKLFRKLVGVPAGEIRLRRSESTTKGGQPPTVGDTVAVTIRPTEHGVEIVGATETFRLDVTQTGTQKLAGMTFGATYVKFDQDIQTDKKIDGRDVSEDGKRLDEHLSNKYNPHGVTLQQLGPLSATGQNLTVTGNISCSGDLDVEAKATAKDLVVTGNTRLGQISSYPDRLTKMPGSWGGVHTWDVYAESSIGCGKNSETGFRVEANGNLGAVNISVGGNLSFGSRLGQLINLSDTRYGIGVQEGTQYFRTKKNFAWYKGGDHNDGELNHGGGVVQMVIKDGNVGIGEADPKHRLTVVGGTDQRWFAEFRPGAQTFTSAPQDWAGGIHTWDVYAEGAIGCGKDGKANCHLGEKGDIYAKSSVRTDGKVTAKELEVTGNAGIGTSTPADALEVAGNLRILTGTGSNPIRFTSTWSDFSNLTDAFTNRAEISNDTKDYKTLMIVGNKSKDQKTRMVSVWDRLEVHGPIKVDGPIAVGGPLTKIPGGWAGGVHTWDVYAEGTIGCGQNGVANCRIHNDGGIVAGKVYAGGGLFFKVGNQWKSINSKKGVFNIDESGGEEFATTFNAGAPSDIRVKTDMRPIPRALDKVLQLQGILFRWSQAGLDYFTRDIADQVSAGPDATPEENQKLWDSERSKTHQALSGEHVGLIAQEVETVLPELVHEDKEGYKHIRYQQVTALLVEAIKEQNAMIQKLSEKLAALGAV